MRIDVRPVPVALLAALLAGQTLPGLAETIRVFADPRAPQVDPVLAELRAATPGTAIVREPLESLGAGVPGPAVVLLDLGDQAALRAMKASGCPPSSDLRPEGFSIRRCGRRPTLWVAGFDRAGLLYGGFELAEQLAADGWEGVRDTDQRPRMPLRGVKLNLPLDVRTPTYSDPGAAAQANLSEVWSPGFWRATIDRLARHRYNLVSLWSLHPFPSMVRVPEYPDIALEDVLRSTGLVRRLYPLSGRGLDSPEILERPETVRTMTIDEKVDHWRRVMAYGRDRNVRFYVVTWNVYPYGTFGKHGITADLRNETTVDYYRASVRHLFRTYPDLAGVGLTTGENMPGASFEEKERWAFRTYGLGVLDVLEEQPSRRIAFVHRQHEAKATEIARTFAPLVAHPRVDFVFSFKYAQAHALSSPRQTFHPGFVADISGSGLPTLWTLRNDDNYLFRWGAPDFVREFLRGLPAGVSRGYYYGSDGWVWGREILSRTPASPRELELDKHWFSWLLWGRLGYDPDLGNDRLAAILGRRYPGVRGRALLDALQDASMVYPLTTGFHWGALDFQWYVEGSCSRNDEAGTASGYHGLAAFLSHPTHPGTDNVPIPAWVEARLAGRPLAGTPPHDGARRLEEHAERAVAAANALDGTGGPGLRPQLEDIRAMAELGLHYAAKIRAATALALDRATGAREYRLEAVREAQQAAYRWRAYVSRLTASYETPVWFNRLGEVDWRLFLRDALHDVASVGGEPELPSMEPTAGGTILEAEHGASEAPISDRQPGFTGAGYREFSEYQRGDESVEWAFEAPRDGRYVLEVRYAARSMETRAARVVIDGRDAARVALWGTGGRDNWCWDRTSVDLRVGHHTLRLHPNGEFRVDHMNVLRVP